MQWVQRWRRGRVHVEQLVGGGSQVQSHVGADEVDRNCDVIPCPS